MGPSLGPRVDRAETAPRPPNQRWAQATISGQAAGDRLVA